MLSPQRLEKARTMTARHCRSMPGFGFCIFFSASDGRQQALVVHGRGADFDEAWNAGAQALEAGMRERGIADRWLRVDCIDRISAVSNAEFHDRLKGVRRYYFRQGVCFDRQLDQPFTEQELNANAILHDGTNVGHAGLNRTNLQDYARVRFGTEVEADAGSVLLFETRGVFLDDTGAYPLETGGLGVGRRRIEHMSEAVIGDMVASASRYLAGQVDERGLFTYGWYPCFDRVIPSYNYLRHAGTIYTMIEAWGLTRDPALKAAIDRALRYLIENRVPVLQDAGGQEFAMLVDTDKEIKLGGNAVLVLALAKYSEVFGFKDVLPMAERLARGMERLQDPQSGRFVHVVNVPDLSVKEENRIVFYDGEAALALVRLYAATGNDRWLEMAEKAFSYFISAQHWRHNDHWLSYAVNEITLYRPSEDYYRFGVRNFRDHLDFIVNRDTTYPTLLELIMAAQGMLQRLGADAKARHLLDDVDLAHFRLALETRAHRMLDGYFWPEVAMYFRNPERILGSFFVRHRAFQVRIDDVSHYVSGLIAYRDFMLRAGGAPGRAATPAR
jgi:hypothetical protein